MIDAGAPPGFRTPPHCVEAEQAVLGAILYQNEIFGAVSGYLWAEHFYQPVHARMFEAIQRLITSGKQADHVTLLRAFREDPELLELDGRKYLVALAEAGTVRQFDAEAYANHVLDLALQRGLLRVAEDVTNLVHDPTAAETGAEKLAALEKGAAQLRRDTPVLFHRTPANIPLTPTAWRQRDLPADDLLLGSLFSSDSRLQFSADTGVGKTMIGLAFAFSIGLGRDFLHWRSHRAGRVLYVDGEMPRREVQKRLAAAASWFDLQPDEMPDDGLWILNREDVPDMPPLDTEDGQRWLLDFIHQRGVVDFIIFDNISALTAGSLKEEDGAQLLKDFQRALTARRVGQLWLHHTGHDATRGYGSKLREWALDVTMVGEKVDRPGADVSFNLTFPKARRRTPENRADYEPVLIELRDGRWTGSIPKQKPRRLAPRAEMCRQALEKAVAEHGTKPPTSSGTNGVSLAVRVETWRDYFNRMAPYEEDEKGKGAKREAWRWGKDKLYAEKVISTWGSWAWLTSRPAHRHTHGPL